MKYTVNQLPEMQSCLDVAPPPSYSCGLDPLKADCKLGEYSCFGKKHYGILEIDLFFSFFCYFCGIDLKGREKRISGVRHVKKIQFPKVASLKRKTFKPWKMLSPVCGLWRKKCPSQRSRRTISKQALSRLYWVSSSVCVLGSVGLTCVEEGWEIIRD